MSQVPAKETVTVEEYNSYVLRYTWRNLFVNAGDGILYAMGQALAPAATVLPGFISDCVNRVPSLLPYKNTLTGLLALIMSVCFMMPQQIWAAKITEGRTRLKRLLIFVAAFERLPWLFMAVMTALVAPANPLLALILFFAIIFSYHFILGIVSPVWQEAVAKVTPVNRRGLLFGIRESTGGFLGVAVLLAAGMVVPGLGFPVNYVFLFSGMFILITLSWLTLFFLKEAPYPIERRERPFSDHVKDVRDILLHDRDFQRYFFCKALYSMSQVAASSFFTMRAISVLGVDAAVALAVRMTMVVTIARGLSVLIGPLGDRYGHRLVLFLANLTGAAGIACALFATTEAGFYAAFAFATVSMMAFWCGHSNYILELAPLEKRPSYISLDNMSGLPFVAAPLLGGFLADKSGYTLPFVLGIVFTLAGAVAFLTIAVDPRRKMRRDLVS